MLPQPTGIRRWPISRKRSATWGVVRLEAGLWGERVHLWVSSVVQDWREIYVLRWDAEGYYDVHFFGCRGKSGGMPAFQKTKDEEKAYEDEDEDT